MNVDISNDVKQVKPANLVSVNKKEELKAQKELYDKIDQEMGEKRRRKLEFLRKMNVFYLPAMAVTFVVAYWYMGLRQAGMI